MSINIISPEQFNTVAWKNGLGQTTELAINEGGTLSDFDWRLSIASVTEDGIFSDFSGYDRHLVLISGQGIRLTHDDEKVDELTQQLDMAIFDGGSKTYGKLSAGTIEDFNIMTKSGAYQADIMRYRDQQTIKLKAKTQYFVYTLSTNSLITFGKNEIVLPAQHLLSVANTNTNEILLHGETLIVIQLTRTH